MRINAHLNNIHYIGDMNDFIFRRAAQTLADQTRLRILNLIMSRECCVCEIMQAMDISHTRASRNLKIMYETGFLDMRKEGSFTLYSLQSFSSDHFYSDLLDAVKKSLRGNPIARKDLERLGKAVRRIQDFKQ